MDNNKFLGQFDTIEKALLLKVPGFDNHEGFLRLLNYLLTKKLIDKQLFDLLFEIQKIRNFVINPPSASFQIPKGIFGKIQEVNRLLDIK